MERAGPELRRLLHGGYLSAAPHGLREAFITGGLPGLTATADDVYRLTYQLVAAKNRAHYQRYPADVDVARKVARALAARPATLPDGGTLTVERFQTLGQMLGSSTGSHSLHYLLEDPFAGDELSDDFLAQVQAYLSYASAPLYALVHEACYAQGTATRWSAQRVRAEFAEFAPEAASRRRRAAAVHRRDGVPVRVRAGSGAAAAGSGGRAAGGTR